MLKFYFQSNILLLPSLTYSSMESIQIYLFFFILLHQLYYSSTYHFISSDNFKFAKSCSICFHQFIFFFVTYPINISLDIINQSNICFLIITTNYYTLLYLFSPNNTDNSLYLKAN